MRFSKMPGIITVFIFLSFCFGSYRIQHTTHPSTCLVTTNMELQLPGDLSSGEEADFTDLSDISTASTLTASSSSTVTSIHIPPFPEQWWPKKVGLPDLFCLLLFTIFFRILFAKTSDTEPRANRWVRQFVSSRGNEYFCEIDEEYLTDRFNLTGLNTEVHYYQHALDLVNDVFDLDCDDEMREAIEKSARHLYGLVHARYIVTTRGLAKMVSVPLKAPHTQKSNSRLLTHFPLSLPQLEKYKRADFGKCPRILCDQHPLLPMGMSDIPHQKPVKMYCAKCEDLYNPKATRHATIDGAYFGSSFHNILFQVYPALVPEKSRARYVPRVFGFKVHAAAALARWQDGFRIEQRKRLREAGVENAAFVEDEEMGDELEVEEEEADEEDGLLDEHEGSEDGEDGEGNGMEEVKK